MEDFEQLKEKVLKYVLYKKRTEQEIRKKFELYTGNILDNVIEYLKDAGYIDDIKYIEKSINEFLAINNLSIKEIEYKLISKGIDSSIIQDFIYNNKEELTEYEINSAKKIIRKKQRTLELVDVILYLQKKGYKKENIFIAVEGEQ